MCYLRPFFLCFVFVWKKRLVCKKMDSYGVLSAKLFCYDLKRAKRRWLRTEFGKLLLVLEIRGRLREGAGTGAHRNKVLGKIRTQ